MNVEFSFDSFDVIQWFFWIFAIFGFIFTFFIALPIFVAYFRTFIKHSKSEWVRNRKFVPTIVVAIMGVSMVILASILSVFCAMRMGNVVIYQYFDFFVDTTFPAGIAFLFYFGWYRIKLNEALCEWSWKKEINPLETHFVIKYQKYLNNRWLVAFVFALCAVFIPVIMFFISHRLLHSVIPHTLIVYAWMLLTMSALAPIMLSWSITISKIHDVYLIREQTMKLLLFFIPLQVLAKASALGLELFAYPTEGSVMSLLGDQIAIMVTVYMLIIWPLRRFVTAVDDTDNDRIPSRLSSIQSMTRTTQSSRRNTESSQTAPATNLCLRKVLSNEDLFKAFATHLVSEYSSENLLFLVEVMQWKMCVLAIYKRIPNEMIQSKSDIIIPTSDGDKYLNSYSDANILEVGWLPIHPMFDQKRNSVVSADDSNEWLLSVLKMAQYLYNKYIVISAALSVNISYDDRRHCNETLEALTECIGQSLFVDSADIFLTKMDQFNAYSMFDDAFRSVTIILDNDSIRRFKRSTVFDRWKDSFQP